MGKKNEIVIFFFYKKTGVVRYGWLKSQPLNLKSNMLERLKTKTLKQNSLEIEFIYLKKSSLIFELAFT